MRELVLSLLFVLAAAGGVYTAVGNTKTADASVSVRVTQMEKRLDNAATKEDLKSLEERVNAVIRESALQMQLCIVKPSSCKR